MRVKCPNSDIYLDLPGDKMDMKFTCPACKKVHRVTVTITSPGEIVPVNKVPPPMPKKYATGAYPPVVDIPIDADFVLFDTPEASQYGIDLGQAADAPVPPFVDRSMSERKTEVRRDPPRRDSERVAAPAEDKPREPLVTPPPEPQRDAIKEEFLKPASDASTQVAFDEESDAAPAAEDALPGADAPTEHAEPNPADDNPAPEPGAFSGTPGEFVTRAAPAGRQRGSGRKLFGLIALLIALALAYLGWNQYLQIRNRHTAGDFLASARETAAAGDLSAASQSARKAEEALGRDGEFHSGENVWNLLATHADFLPPIGNDNAVLAEEIATHKNRAETFAKFASAAATAQPGDMTSLLSDGLAEADAANDADLAAAMRRAVVDRIVAVAADRNPAVKPEDAVIAAAAMRRDVLPLLDRRSIERLDEGIGQATRDQTERFRQDVKRELADIDAAAGRGDPEAVKRFGRLDERLMYLPVFLMANFGDGDIFLSDMLDPQWQNLPQVDALARILKTAQTAAHSALALEEPEPETFIQLASMAEKENEPNPKLAEGVVQYVEDATLDVEKLFRLREDLFYKLQSENRRDKISPGTMAAWRLLVSTFGNPNFAVDPALFQYDSRRAEIGLRIGDVPIRIRLEEDDIKRTLHGEALGYRLRADWAPFFNKPINWMTEMAAQLRNAKIDPVVHPDWEVMEGPGGLVAVTVPPTVQSSLAAGSLPAESTPRHFFSDGRLYAVQEARLSPEVFDRATRFREAARALHDGIMADETIPQAVRQALKPVLTGAYLPIDPRDYFDAAFCRRLLEADYLETFIKPMPSARQQELDNYRTALGKLEGGYDEFTVRLDNGDLLAAVANMEQGLDEGKTSDQDMFSGEIIPRYSWRVENGETTVFHSPMPSRANYAFSLAEYYHGRVKARPEGVPYATEVRHATKGILATYRHGDLRADGDETLWNEAIAQDIGGGALLNPAYGPPGWNFPIHILERNGQGDPVAIATLDGIVPSPDFSAIADPEQRREAEDAWLDLAAKTLTTPGEMGLIFHQFFRYCSDSPLPEMPNLIGSHFGSSDTHQTVYQSLERRWVGRFIGDCDDLAEVFQVMTGREGKLSYVMNLPAHAACGYVDKLADDEYRFIVLQTGPVLRFDGKTLNEVVEAAYRHFDRSAGESQLTMDAVPLLLRFADEEVRTPFILSSRIYEDRDYAEAMIRVQAYWHENTLSAAVKEMEKMLETDREIGSVKELGSLYERVGLYKESAELRRQELEMVRDNPQATLSTLMEIAQLHIQDKNKPEALKALYEMEDVMRVFIKDNDAATFMRALSFRSNWAILLSRLGEPARAWELVKYDVDFAKRQRGSLTEPVLRTLIFMYDKMSLNRDIAGRVFTDEEKRTMDIVGKELDNAFARGFFEADDDYTRSLMRYFYLARYGVAQEGRDKGLALLAQDGPYPTGPRDHMARGREITDEDWAWARIVPQVYLLYGMEKLDHEESPELYDPQAAKPLFEDVTRAVEKGAGLGSDVMGADDSIRAAMTLSFINRDIAAFRTALAVVLEKNYSRLYDDIAMTFGLNCELIPLEEFDQWIDAFHDYFPGKQHYFKIVYRAVDKENYDHALKMAEATARFFPDEKLLVEEAEYIRKLVPELKLRKLARPSRLEAATPEPSAPAIQPAEPVRPAA